MNAPNTTHRMVEPGLPLPPLETTTTIEDLVRWSAAADDYTTFHFDPAAAAARGFEGPLVHGTYQASLIAKMLTDWLGKSGILTALSCRYQRPVIVGHPLVCQARVTEVTISGGNQEITVDVWTESPAGQVATTGTANLRRPIGAVGSVSLIGDELLAAYHIGEVVGSYTFEVTAERIWRFASILRDIDLETVATHRTEQTAEPAPTTFFAALDPLELKIMSHGHGLDLIPYRPTGGGNAFNEIVYDRPILAGDVVTVEVAYTEIYQKNGRRGPLVFRVRENKLTDASGTRIGVARSGHVYAFEVPGYEPPPRSPLPTNGAGAETAGEELPPVVRTPTTATLVRYAAAADDYAPLHYDHAYARSRGYDGVIVHGFLKAGYMATVLEEWAGPGGFVNRFRAEYRGADYPDQPLTVRGHVLRRFDLDGKRAADVELWTERADGSVSTRGSATVVFPDRDRSG